MINAIVAIGKSGQMGLNGRLPWHDREDLLWFRRKTMGGVLICGVKTLAGLPDSVHEGRRIIAWTRENLEDVIREVKAIESPVWVIGGAETYRVWAPHIDRWHIGRINYDGPADTWFDPTLISDLGLGPVPPAAPAKTFEEFCRSEYLPTSYEAAEDEEDAGQRRLAELAWNAAWAAATETANTITTVAEASAPHIQDWAASMIKERDQLQGMIGHILAAIPEGAAIRDVRKYIKDLHQERDDLESALRSLMDWTVQNVDAPDCAPYNYAARLLRQLGAENGTTEKGADHEAC